MALCVHILKSAAILCKADNVMVVIVSRHLLIRTRLIDIRRVVTLSIMHIQWCFIDVLGVPSSSIMPSVRAITWRGKGSAVDSARAAAFSAFDFL